MKNEYTVTLEPQTINENYFTLAENEAYYYKNDVDETFAKCDSSLSYSDFFDRRSKFWYIYIHEDECEQFASQFGEWAKLLKMYLNTGALDLKTKKSICEKILPINRSILSLYISKIDELLKDIDEEIAALNVKLKQLPITAFAMKKDIKQEIFAAEIKKESAYNYFNYKILQKQQKTNDPSFVFVLWFFNDFCCWDEPLDVDFGAAIGISHWGYGDKLSEYGIDDDLRNYSDSLKKKAENKMLNETKIIKW